MKIGFVLDDGLDVPDGVQQYVLALGAWLTAKGHSVHYLVGQTSRDDIPNSHSLGKNIAVRFNGNRLSIPFSASRSRVKELLASEKFDVLHVQMPYSPQLAGKVITYASPETAVIGTFHILPYGRLQTAGTWLLTKVVATTLKRFDAVVAVSTAAKEFADTYLPIPTRVVPNAVNLQKFAKGHKLKRFNDSKQNIVFLGRLVERKGCMELLRAIKVLVHTHRFTNIRVIIAGHGPDREKIEKFIASNELTEYVEMIGWITEEEKPDYLSSADVAVFPSLSGESFGIVLVEAIAAGAGVVLGGDNPGYRYVLDNNKDSLVKPSNAEQFAAQLLELLKDTTLRAKLHKLQNERIKAFEVDVVGQELVKLYGQEIAKRTHNRNNGRYE